MMKLSVLLCLLVLLIQPLMADSKLDFKPADLPKALLERQAGQVVELRLKSGEKISGKVVAVGNDMVHLTQLTGMEFFEAAVLLSDISAVVVRSK